MTDAMTNAQPDVPAKARYAMSVVAVACGIGLMLVRLPWSAPSGVRLTIPLALWPRALGLLVIANVLAMWIVLLARNRVISWVKLDKDTSASVKTFVLLGFAEGTLYPLALISGVKELIAVWLGFKAVAVWRGHAGDSAGSESHQARQRYNFYLFNNALRLGLGAVTYMALLFWAR